MKKVFFLLIALSFLFLTAGQLVYAKDVEGKTGAVTNMTIGKNVGNTVCPVSGDKISQKTKVTYEYKGKVYNLCCAGCIEPFKKDPEKYVKIAEDEMKGKSTVK